MDIERGDVVVEVLIEALCEVFKAFLLSWVGPSLPY